MDIDQCIALVTGGNRGIGEAFVRELLKAGSRHVYVGARDTANAEALVAELGERTSAVALDVTNPAQIAAAATACPDVSILINNSCAFLNRRLIAADDVTAAREEMEVNYFGILQMCRAFAPILARNG